MKWYKKEIKCRQWKKEENEYEKRKKKGKKNKDHSMNEKGWQEGLMIGKKVCDKKKGW